MIKSTDFRTIARRLKRRFVIRLVSGVAAAAVLLLGLGEVISHYSSDRKEQPEIFVEKGIEPGKLQATLVLASGVEVPVAAVDKELTEQDGTFIKVSNDGNVSYRGGNTIRQQGVSPIFHRMCVPRGGEFSLTLEDGTRVWLNSDTELKYPIHFTENNREVYLKGEAYFSVEKDATRPFVVIMDDVRVKVHGTEFNVSTHFGERIETVLVEGSVSIMYDKNEVKLQPNEKADFWKSDRKVQVAEVDVTSYVSWKDGSFVFQHETIEQIMNKLSLWYDVEVFYKEDSLKKVCLSGDMKRYKEITNLLYYFEKISKLKFEIEGRTITVLRR